MAAVLVAATFAFEQGSAQTTPANPNPVCGNEALAEFRGRNPYETEACGPGEYKVILPRHFDCGQCVSAAECHETFNVIGDAIPYVETAGENDRGRICGTAETCEVSGRVFNDLASPAQCVPFPMSNSECASIDPFKTVHDPTAEGNCRNPRTDEECDTTSPLRPIHDPDAEGDCRAKTQAECAPRYSDENLPGNCRNPRTSEECAAVNPSRPRFAGGICRLALTISVAQCMEDLGEEYNVIERGECATECEGNRIFDETGGECRDQTMDDCLEDAMILRTDGSCGDPVTAAECAIAGRGQFLENGACAEACSAGRVPDANRICEEGQTTVECSAGLFLDLARQVCVPPRNDTECERANSALPVFDAGTCREAGANDCRSDEFFDALQRRCRAPQNNSECETVSPNRPFFDGSACRAPGAEGCRQAGRYFDAGDSSVETDDRCRAPARDFECAWVDATAPVFDEGACRALESQNDCDPGEYFEAGDPNSNADNVCRLPLSNAECSTLSVAQPVYDSSATGNCRAPQNDAECAAIDALRPKFESGACRALALSDCGSDEKIEDGRCASLAADDCSNAQVFDGGVCRARTQTQDCTPLGLILSDGGVGCRSPVSANECAGIAGASFEVIENAACARECGENRTAGANGICAGSASGTAPAESAIASPAASPAASSSDDSGGSLPLVAPAIVGLYFFLHSIPHAAFPEFNFSGDGRDEAWLYGGRIEYAGKNWNAYASASGRSEESGPVYETGGRFSDGFWDASYRTKETGASREYELSLGGGWNPGIWEIRPAWSAELLHDAEEGAWNSSSSLGVGMNWVAHKWRMRQDAGFAWNSDASARAAPKMRIDVERSF